MLSDNFITSLHIETLGFYKYLVNFVHNKKALTNWEKLNIRSYLYLIFKAGVERFSRSVTIQSKTDFFFDKTPFGETAFASLFRGRISGSAVFIKLRKLSDENIREVEELLDRYCNKYLLKNIVFLPFASDISELITEAREVLLEELDFSIEKENHLLFMAKYKGSNFASIPGIYPEACHSGQLVTEFIEGYLFSEFIAKSPGFKSQLAGQLINNFWYQLLHINCLQADFHFNNLLVNKQLHYIDLARVHKVNSKDITAICHLINMFLEKKTKVIIDKYFPNNPDEKKLQLLLLRLADIFVIPYFCSQNFVISEKDFNEAVTIAGYLSSISPAPKEPLILSGLTLTVLKAVYSLKAPFYLPGFVSEVLNPAALEKRS